MPNSQEPPQLAVWLVRTITLFFFRIFYKVKARGVETLPEGGFLMLPNHLTWIDAVVLQAACPRPIRFIVWEEYYRSRRLAPLMRFFGVLPISSKRAKDTMKHSVDALKRGEIVCIFPEGELSKSGALLRIQRGYEVIAAENRQQAIAEVRRHEPPVVLQDLGLPPDAAGVEGSATPTTKTSVPSSESVIVSRSSTTL